MEYTGAGSALSAARGKRAQSAKSLNRSQSASGLRCEPSWIAHDREVLRFFVYFKEAVPESALESWRLRKLSLLYFLDRCGSGAAVHAHSSGGRQLDPSALAAT